MRIEWDEDKAAANEAKHGVSFNEAIEVFGDPNAIEYFDEAHSDQENRFVRIGYATQKLLFVVFVERIDEVIRLISARKPTASERKLYEQGQEE